MIEEAVRYIDELHMALMSKLMAKGKDRLQCIFVCSIYLSGPYMGMLHFLPAKELPLNIYIKSDDMWLSYNFQYIWNVKNDDNR